MKKQKIVFALAVIVFLVSISTLIYCDIIYRINASKFESLVTEAESGTPNENKSPTDYCAVLQKRNPDFVGWIKIPQTNINYPVMATPLEPEFYLRRDFDKAYAICGTPFLGAGCDINSQCAIIYSHNMDDGSMFGQLKKYASQEFCEQHPIIYL